jgi:hypothetical protein
VAGRTGDVLIPGLDRFRPEWLNNAEVSFSLDDQQPVGLSFFFDDETTCADFAASESLEHDVISSEKAVRTKYSILPRYWLKLHLNGVAGGGLSQYFQIDPNLYYPITTVRRFLRDYGLSDVGSMEELLKPSLENRDTQWGLALKRYADRVTPRIFFRVPRSLLERILNSFVRFDYLSDSAASHYLEWEKTIRAGNRVFVSADPKEHTLSSLDFCDVPAEQFSFVLHPGFPENFKYLKIRISESVRQAEFTAYMPFRDAGGLLNSNKSVQCY